MAPKQKPGKSRQDYRTPPELLRAIECEFHVEQWDRDLAANQWTAIRAAHSEDETTGKPHHFDQVEYLGPGSPICEDSLAFDWANLPGEAWLNQPFANIAPWAKKCATTKRDGRIFQLVPASVGSNWYQEYVHGKAHVVALSPRVTFVGEAQTYPKDIALAIWSGVRGGFSTWRWK
jgi:hypothetical protein